MATFVTQPQAGGLLFTGKDIGIQRLTHSIRQTGDEHIVGRRQVSGVTRRFRAAVICLSTQIPVAVIWSAGPTLIQEVLISTTNSTPVQGKLPCRITADINNFDAFKGARPDAPNIVYRDITLPCGIPGNNQSIRYRCISGQDSIEGDHPLITGVITINGEGAKIPAR